VNLILQHRVWCTEEDNTEKRSSSSISEQCTKYNNNNFFLPTNYLHSFYWDWVYIYLVSTVYHFYELSTHLNQQSSFVILVVLFFSSQAVFTFTYIVVCTLWTRKNCKVNPVDICRRLIFLYFTTNILSKSNWRFYDPKLLSNPY